MAAEEIEAAEILTCYSKKSQFRFDRFTFYNDGFYFAELANEEQAKRAVQKLEQSTTFKEERPTFARILSPEFAWKAESNHLNRWIYDDGSAVAEAVRPLKEGRRIQLRVRTPAWQPQFDTKPKNLMRARMNYGRELVAKAFDKFGVEAIGVPAANDGRMLPDPKFFCHIDFKTKEGAEEAVRTMHETKLEELLIWVVKSELNEVRSRQIGRVNMGVLKELQELGLAPEVDWEKK
jgi:RNA recognition motif-containing protein